jgi:serine/threonine protein kinase
MSWSGFRVFEKRWGPETKGGIETLAFSDEAVAYTHANKLAHMDIKPENILLDETKTLAKLCDFGCAYFLQSSIRSSMTRRGTTFFMAPEINLRDVKLCDPFRVDVYAFGVSLFYLMKPDANCDQLTACDWDLLPDIPTELRALKESCKTRKNPEVRPAMHAVHSLLELIAAALWAVERLLKSAGIVPAEDHPVFARLLNAQGTHDKKSLLKSLTDNPRLLSTIGMSFYQQSCLMRYLGCGSARVKPAAESASSANTSE